MGLFGKLFGRTPDPTADWPAAANPLPPIGLEPFAIGPLRLGDRLDAARFLGRPDACELSKTPGSLTLDYVSRGLELTFEEFRLGDVRFSIGYGTFFSPKPGEPLCSPRLVNGTHWSDETTRDDIERLMGKPTATRIDQDDGEVSWSYQLRDVAMRFQFTPQGLLAVWSVYGD